MRKQTEISLVAKRPHLFHETVLSGLGITGDNQESTEDKKVRYRWDYKDGNFFECGEGWMPIIAAFAEILDHFLSEYEIADADDKPDTEKPTVYISGAMSHHHRLCIIVDRSSEYDDAMLSKIVALKEFAAVMSSQICEVCGAPVAQAELDARVRCVVCSCRHT